MADIDNSPGYYSCRPGGMAAARYCRLHILGSGRCKEAFLDPGEFVKAGFFADRF
jgi:hypothetical protein